MPSLDFTGEFLNLRRRHQAGNLSEEEEERLLVLRDFLRRSYESSSPAPAASGSPAEAEPA